MLLGCMFNYIYWLNNIILTHWHLVGVFAAKKWLNKNGMLDRDYKTHRLGSDDFIVEDSPE